MACRNVVAALILVLFSASGFSQNLAESSPQVEQKEATQLSRDESNNKNGLENTTGSDSVSEEFNALSAQAWMQRFADTIKQLSFELSFVATSKKLETMPYVWRHVKYENGDEAEQLSLLNGPGFEQIRFNDKVSIFEPGFPSISIRSNVIESPIPNAFTRDIDKLNEAYDMLLMGRDRISGRMAQQIRVVSKDKSRYQYQLWLDDQTGLLLKLNMYDLKGGLVKQIQVTNLLVDENIKDKFTNISYAELPPFTSPNKPLEKKLPWRVSYVPKGMKIVAQNFRRIPTTNQPAEYVMLSDGLADVSVYVTEASENNQESIALLSDTQSIVSISNGRIQVTVIGEIPIDTADKIANSIVLIP